MGEDKYLSLYKIIAVGVIGLNFHLFNFDLVSEAKAWQRPYEAEYPGQALNTTKV